MAARSCATASGATRVIGFDRASLREPQAAVLYSETVTTGQQANGPTGQQANRPAGSHVIQKNLSILRALQIEPGDARLPLAPKASAATLAAIDSAGGPLRYIVLNPGAAWPNKRWPPERFGAVAAALKNRTGLRSLVTWGPAERELADTVVRGSDGAASLAPPTSVSDLAVLMRDAALVVSGDTGPLHIAAAMGAPLVGLYGPTWPERNGPWDPRDVVISRAGVCVCHHKRQCLRDRRASTPSRSTRSWRRVSGGCRSAKPNDVVRFLTRWRVTPASCSPPSCCGWPPDATVTDRRRDCDRRRVDPPVGRGISKEQEVTQSGPYAIHASAVSRLSLIGIGMAVVANNLIVAAIVTRISP